MADDESSGEQPIIIKKIVAGHGHHGGAWKVAYADFVTAMMAFFLLMWLLNATTEEQKKGLSDYFSPTPEVVSAATSGAGGVLGGLSAATEGAQVSQVQPLTQSQPTGQAGQNQDASKATKGGAQDPVEAAKEQIRAEEEEKLKEVQDAIEEAMQQNPELAELAENLIIDMTPEGLRIQVVDAEGKPMFPSGSARMFEKTRTLMSKVAEIVQDVPNEVSVRGHTDGVPFGSGGDYTNWELSTDRANSSRRVLENGGIAAERLNNVVGKADTEHLLPDDPTNARNRRISIILLREELTDPEGYAKRAEELAEKRAEEAAAQGENTPAPLSTEGLPVTPAPILEDGTPALPTPRTGDFEKSDGDVTFP